ncbi:MAG: TIGR00297 family protein [Terriglobales bacterium]
MILSRRKQFATLIWLLLASVPARAGVAFAPLATVSRHRVLAAIFVTVLFAAFAHRVRAVDTSGAFAGAVVSFLLYVSCGPAGFACLVTVFLLAWGSTRFGYARKQRLGMAERKFGRNAWQVLANLVVAAALAVASLYFDRTLLLLGVVAALAEAAADTVSSELGKALTTRVYLITTFERVPVGTDGAISVIGTMAGVAAAILVGVVATVTALIPQHWIAATAGAAILGNCIDSVLGAVLQQRGWVSNNTVNLLSTSAAAGLVLLFLI